MKSEVLLVSAEVDGEEDEVLVFRVRKQAQASLSPCRAVPQQLSHPFPSLSFRVNQPFTDLPMCIR